MPAPTFCRPVTVVGFLVLGFITVCQAQSISSISSTIGKLAQYLSGLPGASEVTSTTRATELLLKTVGKLGAKEFKVQVKNWASSGGAVSYATHLERVDEASSSLQRLVEEIDETSSNSSADQTPEEYCKSEQKERELIDMLGERERLLQELINLTRSYLRVMPSLDSIATVYRNAWESLEPLARTYDATIEQTSVGTFMEQYLFWTEEAGPKSGEVWQRLRGAERRAVQKMELLKRRSELSKAKYYQFFSSMASVCRQRAAQRTMTESQSSALDELDADVNDYMERARPAQKGRGDSAFAAQTASALDRAENILDADISATRAAFTAEEALARQSFIASEIASAQAGAAVPPAAPREPISSDCSGVEAATDRCEAIWQESTEGRGMCGRNADVARCVAGIRPPPGQCGSNWSRARSVYQQAISGMTSICAKCSSDASCKQIYNVPEI